MKPKIFKKSLLDFCSDYSNIHELIIYGSNLNFQSNKSDLDILIITEQSHEIRNLFERSFKSEWVDIINSSSNNYFYNYHNDNTLTIDLDIHDPNTDFFSTHKLLGISIFSNFEVLYTNPNSTFVYPVFPSIDFQYRSYLFMHSRKGLNDCYSWLIRYRDKNQVDLRRVFKQLIRNIYWVNTNERSYCKDTESIIKELNYIESITELYDFIYYSNALYIDKYEKLIFWLDEIKTTPNILYK